MKIKNKNSDLSKQSSLLLPITLGTKSLITCTLHIFLIALICLSVVVLAFNNLIVVELNIQIDKQPTLQKAIGASKRFLIYKLLFFAVSQIRYLLSAPLLESFKVALSIKLYRAFLTTRNRPCFGTFQVLLQNAVAGFSRLIEIIFFDFLNQIVLFLLSVHHLSLRFGKTYTALLLCVVILLLLLEYKFNKKVAKLAEKSVQASYRANEHLRESDHCVDIILAHDLLHREAGRYSRLLAIYKKHKVWLDMVSSVEGILFPVLFQLGRFLAVFLFLQENLALDVKNEKLRLLMSLADSIYTVARSLTLLYTNFRVCVVKLADSIPLLLPEQRTTTFQRRNFDFSVKINTALCLVGTDTFLTLREFEILKGKKIAVTGENGSGKSTLLKLLAGLIEFKGSVSVDRCQTTELALEVAYVPQSMQLLKRNLPFNNSKECHKEQSDFDELSKRFSQGYQQKMQLLRALHKNACLLLLDEPFVHLDANCTNEFIELFFNNKNWTVVVVTRNQNVIRRCDMVYYINKGLFKRIN